MDILVVGGTGMVGADAAVRLRGLGHAVAIAARRPPPPTSPVAGFGFRRLDYVEDEPDAALLEGFEAMVFAAGNDVRHAPRDAAGEAEWERANAKATPAFFRAARQAGVRRAILIGSFYPQAAPHLVASDRYVASRLAAEQGVLALAAPDFQVTALNAPWIIGWAPGVPTPGTAAIARWALGRRPEIPRVAAPGGVNMISTDTLSDAIVGALAHGRSAHAYLIGDENLTFQAYFSLYFQAAGELRPLEIRDGPHRFLPPASVLAGPGSTLFYEPDPVEVAELGYRRSDIARTVARIVEAER